MSPTPLRLAIAAALFCPGAVFAQSTPPADKTSCTAPSTFPDPTLACQQVTTGNSPDHRTYVATTTASSSTVTPSGGTAYTQIAITVSVLSNGSEMARETSYFTSLDSSSSS